MTKGHMPLSLSHSLYGSFLGAPPNGFCLYLIGPNYVIWPALATKKAGKCSFSAEHIVAPTKLRFC